MRRARLIRDLRHQVFLDDLEVYFNANSCITQDGQKFLRELGMNYIELLEDSRV